MTLQSSGNVLADRMGLQGAVFGATILALATALPELSSGIEAVRLGDHQLAMGDILGGNAFQLTLFVLADILAGTPVIVAARGSDVWLGAAGVADDGDRGGRGDRPAASDLPPARDRLVGVAR